MLVHDAGLAAERAGPLTTNTTTARTTQAAGEEQRPETMVLCIGIYMGLFIEKSGPPNIETI